MFSVFAPVLMMTQASRLAAEAGGVMALRLIKLSVGGGRAHAEAQRMVSEKYIAAMRASAALAFGGTPGDALQVYARAVRANTRRLSRRRR